MTTQDVWNLYATDVKRFILSKVKHSLITDDILQDTFLKIHTKLHTLKEQSKLKSWVFSIARNTMLDYFRTQNKSFEITDLEIDYQEELDSHNEQDCLRGIIKNLPREHV